MDNAYNDINNQYIPDNIPPADDAWEKMKNMLDTEMPVAGNGKSGSGGNTGIGKSFFGSNLFWGGLIVLIAGIGTYYFTSSKNNHSSSNIISEEKGTDGGVNNATGSNSAQNTNDENVQAGNNGTTANTMDNTGAAKQADTNASVNENPSDVNTADDNKQTGKAAIAGKANAAQANSNAATKGSSIGASAIDAGKKNDYTGNKSSAPVKSKDKLNSLSVQKSNQDNSTIQAAVTGGKKDKQGKLSNDKKNNTGKNNALRNNDASQIKIQNNAASTTADNLQTGKNDISKIKNDKANTTDNNAPNINNSNTVPGNTQDNNNNGQPDISNGGQNANAGALLNDSLKNTNSPLNNSVNNNAASSNNNSSTNTANTAAGNTAPVKSTNTKAKNKGNSSAAKKTNGNGAGIDVDAGLQLNPVLPITGNGYSYNLNGSVAPYTNFIPGVYLSLNKGKSVFTADINPWHVNYLSGKSFYDSTAIVQRTDDSGHVFFHSVNTNKSFLKTFSFNAGLSWDYQISDHLSAGLSLRGNFGINALVRKSGYIDSTGLPRVNLTDSFYKATNGELSLLSKSQFWLMPQLIYTTGRWQFGLRAGLPINKISLNALNTPKYPFNAELLIRFNLNKKK